MNAIKDFMKKYGKPILKYSIITISVLSFFMYFVSFFVFFYKSDQTSDHLILSQHFNGDTFKYSDEIAYFSIFTILLCFSFALTIVSALSFLSKKPKYFYKISMANTGLNFFYSLIFFATSALFCIIYNSQSTQFGYSTNGYIPFILTSITLVIEYILLCVYRNLYLPNETSPSKFETATSKNRFRIEGLIYAVLVTILSYASLGINIVNISFETTSSLTNYESKIHFNALDQLKNYSTMAAANQSMAFALIVFYIVSGMLLLLVLASFFAKLESYNFFVSLCVSLNFFLVFLFSIAGLYFSIAQSINIQYIKSILESKGYDGTLEYKYKVTTDFVYLLIPDFILLVVCLVRKKLTGFLLTNATITGNEGSSGGRANGTPSVSNSTASNAPFTANPNLPLSSNSQSSAFNHLSLSIDKLNDTIKIQEEEKKANPDNDPCEAFTQLENEKDEFQKELHQRQATIKSPFTLKTLVRFIVQYAKDSPKHLSYTPEAIATFIAGMGFSKLSILQGMSGTGKTSLPKIFAEAIDGECRILEVESSWKDKNELIGFYNQFTKKFIPTKFTRALYEASLNPDVIYLLVLDEMNLSRIEYYFSDFLSLMENEENKRFLTLVNIPLNRVENGKPAPYQSLIDNQTLPIPQNIWFVGTANNDESTYAISDKVYDRANIMDFDKRAAKVRNYSAPIPNEFVSYPTLQRLINQSLNSIQFDAEKNETINKVEELLRPYNISFGNRILMQIEKFVTLYNDCFDQDRTFEAIESILLVKVVSKLKNKIIEDKEYLIEQFKALGLNRCADFVSTLNND